MNKIFHFLSFILILFPDVSLGQENPTPIKEKHEISAAIFQMFVEMGKDSNLDLTSKFIEVRTPGCKELDIKPELLDKIDINSLNMPSNLNEGNPYEIKFGVFLDENGEIKSVTSSENKDSGKYRWQISDLVWSAKYKPAIIDCKPASSVIFFKLGFQKK